MTLQELDQKLQSSGLPVVYRAWAEDTAPPLPWICYAISRSNNFVADGEVYLPINRAMVELYTKLKDPLAEEKVETALKSVVWEKTETYIDSEKCYRILYEIEV